MRLEVLLCATIGLWATAWLVFAVGWWFKEASAALFHHLTVILLVFVGFVDMDSAM